VADFVKKGKLSQRVLLNGGEVAMELFGVRQMPASFLIDPQGNVLERTIGFDDPAKKERKVVAALGK